MALKNKNELVKQIEAYGLKNKLADKSVLVRKKLNDGVQYALNRYIKFVDESKK